MGTFRHTCVTDVGKQKAVNEDRWFADPERGLYVVADGMANDLAPQELVDRLPELFNELVENTDLISTQEFAQEVHDRINQLNLFVHQQMVESQEAGLGTTLVLAIFKAPTVLLSHVGDSRAYFYRNDKLDQITIDHSFLQSMLDRGLITAEEAETHGNGGPTQFLGMENPVFPGICTFAMEPGDRLLLCTDGLTEMVSDEGILSVFQRRTEPEEICQELVDVSNQAGGRDNVTVLILAAD
ncbi:MAG: PP2C family protein-serine/threonine phosphatase [Gemmataceae bacterium]